MMKLRAMVIAGIAVAALAAWGIVRFAGKPGKPEAHADVEACVAAQRDVANRRTTRGRAPAGEPTDAAVISRACAPLFHQPECQSAMMDFDGPPGDRRVVTVLGACAHAYCPSLPAPKPAACAAIGAQPQEILGQWNELRATLLRHEVGDADADRVMHAVR